MVRHAGKAAVPRTKLEVKPGPAWIKYLKIGMLISDQFSSSSQDEVYIISNQGFWASAHVILSVIQILRYMLEHI